MSRYYLIGKLMPIAASIYNNNYLLIIMNSINQSNIEIICCELSNPITEVDDKLMSLISTEKRRNLENRKNLTNKKLSLYGELFVRHYIVSRRNIKNCDIRFEKNEYGKLYLADLQDLYFNISHSQNAVVVAFSRHENGIDIEKIRNINLKIADHCLSIEENEYIRNSRKQLSSFWEIWTKKEAYLKYVGVGIVNRLMTFNVLNNQINSIIHTMKYNQFIISCCCTENERTIPSLQIVSESDVDEMFAEIC